MAKAVFTTRNGMVSVSYDDEMGDRVTRTFRVLGSYVYEVCEDGRHSQICEGLSTRGRTLQCDAQDLPAVIRRHYRILRKDMARAFA
jgi:hypothetical protein